MKDYRFETHNLEGENIPIIFHYDIAGKYSLANWHNNIEILHFTYGSGYVIAGNDTLHVKKGDITIINTNVLHSIKSDTRLEYHCLIIDNDFLKFNGICCDNSEFSSLIHSDELNTLFLTLVSEIESENTFKEAGIKSAVLNLMLCILRYHSSHTKDNTNISRYANENIRLAIGYIRSHVNEQITLEEIAREVGLSKFYFAREFKKTTGLTLISYINTLRCINAKKLLQKKEYSIHDIAVKCGFENDSYFSKTFKKYTGCLPSDIIKQQYN